MTDWGTGATSKKATSASHTTYIASLQCENCGVTWTYVYYYPSQLTKIQGPMGGYLCEKCREGYEKPVHTPCSPPASVQMTIDEIFKTKK